MEQHDRELDETCLFWNHVRVAQLVTGDPATCGPMNSVGGTIGIQSGTSDPTNTPIADSTGNAIRGTYIICSPNILGKFAKLLDIQLDDGNTAYRRDDVYPVYAPGYTRTTCCIRNINMMMPPFTPSAWAYNQTPA